MSDEIHQIAETIPQGIPSAVYAGLTAAVPISEDETLIMIRVAGSEISAYAKGATDAVRIYGALSLVQKLGLVKVYEI